MAITSKKSKHEENPEWEREDFDKAVHMSRLPASLQRVLGAQKHGPQKAPANIPQHVKAAK